MITRTLHNPLMICNLVITPSPNYLAEQPIFASTCDYGFDFEEDQIAALSDNLSAQSNPDVIEDEFESRYIWFIS